MGLITPVLFLWTHASAEPFKTRGLQGGSWGVNSYGTFVSVATTPDGRVKIAHNHESSNTNLTLRINDAPDPSSGITYETGQCGRKSLQMTPSGEIYVAQERCICQSGNTDKVVEVYYLSGGVAGSPIFVSDRPAHAPSLRIDDAGNLHLAFFHQSTDGTTFDVYYATNRSGSWRTEVVRRDVGVEATATDNRLSLALGWSQNPRVVFRDGTAVYYSLGGNPWVTTLVTETGSLGARSLSLDVDEADVPHLVFSGVPAGTVPARLEYWTKPASGWMTEVLDYGSIVPGQGTIHTSLVLDGSSRPHVSYSRPDLNELRYATRTGASWAIQTVDVDVDPNASLGDFNAIALDVYGDVHIAYGHATVHQIPLYDRHLRYAYAMDCNDNGVHDEDDIAAGVLSDCDGNGHPDECEAAMGFIEDCNANGVPDECEEDCNSNGIPDDCDIASGYSADCDSNGIPDECSAGDDCNGNGSPDLCDIASGVSQDCNQNGIPDECDATAIELDCNGNQILDVCEFGFHLVVHPQTGGEFGTSLAAGDLNDDGLQDLIVGAPLENSTGRVYVFYGGTPPDDTADLILTSSGARRFGQAVATGDVNNDGIDDLVVGAPGSDYYNVSGEVHIFLGGPAPSTIPFFTIEYGSWLFDEQVGNSVALADIDNDGHDDLLVGAPEYSWGARVYLYSTNPLDDEAEGYWTGGFGEDFGEVVAAAGDIDGNGFEDFVVGTSTVDCVAGNECGQVVLLLSDGLGSLTWGPELVGENAEDWLGAGVAGAGDVNGDGFDDLLVGVPGYDDLSWNNGLVQLYHGGPSFDTIPDQSFGGTDMTHQLGRSVAGTDDLDGDGTRDLILGAPFEASGGSARILLGGDPISPDPWVLHHGPSNQAGAGMVVIGVGDMDGDGIGEFAMSSTEYVPTGDQVDVFNLSLPDFADCNDNGAPDACDIATGFSDDDDGNGVPDECQVVAVDGISTAGTVRLLGAYPTPFNPSTRVVFEIPETGEVVLDIFDTTGRLVVSLGHREFQPGRHAISWDGRSEGRPVASGTYYGRLQVGGREFTVKLLLVK